MHARIGYLPENPYFYDYLTPREFLDYCGELFRLDRGDAQTTHGGIVDARESGSKELGPATAQVFKRHVAAGRHSRRHSSTIRKSFFWTSQ